MSLTSFTVSYPSKKMIYRLSVVRVRHPRHISVQASASEALYFPFVVADGALAVFAENHIGIDGRSSQSYAAMSRSLRRLSSLVPLRSIHFLMAMFAVY